jgi:hypothetical protein
MHSLLKLTVLGVGLLAGVSGTAHAQSVSTVPPTSPATAPTATTPPVVSSAKIYPNPGISSQWQEEHYKATESGDDVKQHPYTTPNFGPKTN